MILNARIRAQPGTTGHESSHLHPRAVAIVALTALFAVNGLASNRKSRVFNAQFDAVWTAASEVANDAFLADRSSKAEGKLRFRSGPFRGYRFDVMVVDAGAGRTRVELELRTNLRGVEKDAWRNAERYLTLISQRLQRGGNRIDRQRRQSAPATVEAPAPVCGISIRFALSWSR